jgi:hypothetical protein
MQDQDSTYLNPVDAGNRQTIPASGDVNSIPLRQGTLHFPSKESPL